jgi:hypothetical protein
MRAVRSGGFGDPMTLDTRSPAGTWRRSLATLVLARTALALAATAFLAVLPAHAQSGAQGRKTTPSGSKPAASAPKATGAAQARPQVQSAGTFVPDTTVIARVGPRVIRVRKFIDSYYDADPQTRPAADSAGRAAFLKTMVDKEIIGMVAREVNPPLGFEDRATLRDYTARIVSNMLYQRLVVDSVSVTEEDVRAAHAQFGHELQLKHIQFPERTMAERVRKDLVARRIPWSVAVRRYSTAPDKEVDGQLGWRNRLGLDAVLAEALFHLEPGQISEVVEDTRGFQVVLVTDKRTVTAPALEPLRASIEAQLKGYRAAQRARAIQLELIKDAHVVYHQENCAWTATKFNRAVTMGSDGSAPVLTIDPNLPDISPADTGRVLATYEGGDVTVGDLLHTYGHMPPLLRPPLESAEAVKGQVDGIILEPRMVELAYERGLDKDPEAVELIEHKREGLLVEKIFQDSILSQVRVTDAMRRKYYEDNKPGYFTYPNVRFAALLAENRAEADSLKGLLAGGADPAKLLEADSLRGRNRGSIQSRFQSQQGPYHKLLFEDLRPGKVAIEGPDKEGHYAVIQLLHFDSGRQLEFREVEQLVDESLQNLEAERILNQFVARHRKRFTVEARPELVTQVDFRML